jgi:hypothetical protein
MEDKEPEAGRPGSFELVSSGLSYEADHLFSKEQRDKVRRVERISNALARGYEDPENALDLCEKVMELKESGTSISISAAFSAGKAIYRGIMESDLDYSINAEKVGDRRDSGYSEGEATYFSRRLLEDGEEFVREVLEPEIGETA